MRWRRIAAICAIVLALAPGTWLREGPRDRESQALAYQAVDHEQDAAPPPGWSVAGIWHLTGASDRFGGFSALIPQDGGELRAISDRRWTLLFEPPGAQDRAGGWFAELARLHVGPELAQSFFDAESATWDPATGNFWVGYEFVHAVQRFERRAFPTGEAYLPGAELGWGDNSGAEAMVRLADGRFAIFPETGSEALVYSGDPVEGADAVTVPVEWPDASYAPTDAALLPDGRVAVLMRKVTLAQPPFSALLAVGDADALGGDAPWRPELLLALDPLIPRENYEGLAIVPSDDGGADVWLISDDNFATFQRTLLVHLRYAPATPE